MIDNHQLRHYVKAMSRTRKSLALSPVLAALLALALISSMAWAGAGTDANAVNGGETLDLNSLVTRGKTTLIDFYSPYCPPCVRLAPLMQKLAAKRPNLAIKKANINRPGVDGIDWRSPLAQQHSIRQVPYFMIFSPQGKLVAQGQDAFEQVKSWLEEAGLLKQ